MALNIRNSRAERLADEVARRTGETKTQAVTRALEERLDRLKKASGHRRRLVDDLNAIAEHAGQLPVRDARDPDEILGYGDDGLPR